MDKLHSLSLAFLCGLISTPAFAQATTRSTTPEIMPFQMTLAQTPLPTDCTEVGAPCHFYFPAFSAGGGLGGYDVNGLGIGCLLDKGCVAPDFDAQQVNISVDFFSKPVSFVTALQMTQLVGDEANLFAYNSALQQVAYCQGPFLGPDDCFKVTKVTGTENEAFYTGDLTVTTAPR